MKPIRIPCGSPTCANYLTVHYDDQIPQFWLCPDCQFELDSQQFADYYEQEHPHTTTPSYEQEFTHER